MIQYNKPNINPSKLDINKIKNMVKTGWVSCGDSVNELETIFRDKYNVKHAIACSNATTGLTIAIKAAGWKNKKVLVPSFTWPSTIYAIECSIGCTPIFCDIDKETWCIDYKTVNENNYDVIVAVDTFGNQCEHIPTDKPVIYDAAHGYNLPGLGHRGIAEVVSFSFTKLITAGEGGMILTNDDSLANVAKELRRLSGRMGEFNAILAKNSLDNFDNYYEARKNIIDKYIKNFDFTFTLQKGNSQNYSVFGILLPNSYSRNQALQDLSRHGIETKIYYEPIVSGLKVTDDIFSRIICLPAYDQMEKETDLIINIMNKVVNEHKNSPGKRYLENSGYVK